jgi:YidC/Oxa1 family membrane protein insertase
LFAIVDVPVAGAYQLVLALSGVIPPALTIVLFTIAVRLLLHPLARAAVRGEKARAELAPQLKKLQAKYGNNRERLGQEIAKLQRESGTSLFAGCLPMLLQIPFFIVMFRLFSTGTVAGHPNELLARELFGAPLGLHWSAAPADPVFLVLFAALAVVAWCSARLMRQTAAEAPALLRLLPYGSIVAATVLPLAAGVYLVTTTAWATAERAYLRR